LKGQLRAVKCKALFTCAPLYATAVEAAVAVGMPKERVYLMEIPEKACKGIALSNVKTLDQLVEQGKQAGPLPKLEFTKAQGATQTAFLCSSSGTSGLPKNVKISHRNVIANVLQSFCFELNYKSKKPEMSLGALPLSHSYALITGGHLGVFRGDGLVVLPGFDLLDVLGAIQTYKMGRLWMVPPMVVGMIKAAAVAGKFDLSSVTTVVVGASNLTRDVTDQFKKLFNHCDLVQGYGLTEAAVAVCFQNPHDIMFGACGNLFLGYEARLVDGEGKEVTECDRAGELHLRSPSVMLGYLDNDEATKEAFSKDGWLRTGDLFELRMSEMGHQHLFIVDRLKELIKVRGIQVSPTELEARLARHPLVADSVVVPIPNEAAGELPIAFVVRTAEGKAQDEKTLKADIHAYFNAGMADHKRLAGGIEFVDSLPKTATNKTQRGTMKQKARAISEAARAKAPPVVVQTFEFGSDDDDSD
jgi:acyl-CoA synthetase (AMP-forming)/AMP-acid ligase II